MNNAGKVQLPVKKGDVVALIKHFPSTDRTVYTLAIVTAATKSGLIRRARVVGIPWDSGVKPQNVMTISGSKQAFAVRLAASISYPGKEWDTTDELKAAVLGA